MFGWELPPLYAGGIGMVCYDLIKELSAQGVSVTYVMPYGPDNFSSDTSAQVLIAEQVMPAVKNVVVKPVSAMFTAYDSGTTYSTRLETFNSTIKAPGKKDYRKNLYGSDLYSEVDLFAKRAYEIAKDVDFDVIHAHDWMTFPAAIGVKVATGKPLVVHVHNTIYDRYLGNANSMERDMEYNGLAQADRIIAISQYVKNTIVAQYGINPDKIEVVHNAPNTLLRDRKANKAYPRLNMGNDKVVLFTGRITVQKGPEYFVHMAKKVLEKRKDVKFIMGGTGDMFRRTVDLATHLGISDKFVFTGFYSLDQAQSLYASADCYVMPSVSEPFGLVPLEAMEHGAPTIISRTSGVAEVASHTLKVDFWDTHQMADKVLAVLQYPALREALGQNGQRQVQAMNWTRPTNQCVGIYNQLISSNLSMRY